jgi:hypothetical protein
VTKTLAYCGTERITAVKVFNADHHGTLGATKKGKRTWEWKNHIFKKKKVLAAFSGN